MKTKHTPGPWSINDLMAKDKRRVVFWYYIIDRNRNNIVEVKGRHCGIKNSIAEANVKLIAVAPEMLKGLMDICHMDDDLCKCPSCKIAKPIIQKATS